jgi:hypothetical protein
LLDRRVLLFGDLVSIDSPQRHREHRANFISARSGDGDRAEELSPLGNLLLALDPKMAVSLEAKSLSPSGDGFFPWPSSPGQGKHNILCGLCVSVVKEKAITLL